MTGRSNELETSKSSVNLTEFAVSRGDALDCKASSPNSALMRGPDGDKIVVAKGTDGHFVYFSVGDPGGSGSIIDFLQNRAGGSPRECRKPLRLCIGAGSSPPLHPDGASRPGVSTYMPNLKPIPRDIAAARARF